MKDKNICGNCKRFVHNMSNDGGICSKYGGRASFNSTCYMHVKEITSIKNKKDYQEVREMNKFKVGDRVRIVKNNSFFNQKGLITRIAIAEDGSCDSMDCQIYIGALSEKWFFSEDELELAIEEKFKIGERVIYDGAVWKVTDIKMDNGNVYYELDCTIVDVPEHYLLKISPESLKGRDEVNKPQHYNQGKYEVIDVIEDWGLDKNFCLANAIKYIARAEHKGKYVEDLKKAIYYLEREVKRNDK